MSRIELSDDLMGALSKMAEGNPGALTAMMDLIEKAETIDPQAAMGGIGKIMCLDTYGIYGTDIYILWNDKCGNDAVKMCLLLRSVQLGMTPQSKLVKMAADQMGEVNLSDEEWEDIKTKVCARLEEFKTD